MYRFGEVWQAFATSHLTIALIAIDWLHAVNRLEAFCHTPAPSLLPRPFRHQAAKPPSFDFDGLMLVMTEKTPGSTVRWHCDIEFEIICIFAYRVLSHAPANLFKTHLDNREKTPIIYATFATLGLIEQYRSIRRFMTKIPGSSDPKSY
jgi:hypothetical protein